MFTKKHFESITSVDVAYTTTLMLWLVYNDLTIFDQLLKEFENAEEYLICDGLHRAINFIEVTHEERFAEAAEVHGDVDFNNPKNRDLHIEISRSIFQDVTREIYKEQIKIMEG
jgi:hypothetical protein